MILFKIHLTVERHISMKNRHTIRFNRGSGRRFVSKDNLSIRIQNKMIESLSRHFKIIYNSNKIVDPFINAKFTFYFPKDVFYTKKGKVNKRLNDLSNLYELPQDALQKAGVISDDWLINGHNGSSRQVSYDNEFHLEIELTKITT